MKRFCSVARLTRRFPSCKSVCILGRDQARIQDFGQRGPSGVLTPRGEGPEPIFAQNWGFSLKIAHKLHDFEEILGARGAGPPGIPPLDPLLEIVRVSQTNSDCAGTTVQVSPGLFEYVLSAFPLDSSLVEIAVRSPQFKCQLIRKKLLSVLFSN